MLRNDLNKMNLILQGNLLNLKIQLQPLCDRSWASGGNTSVANVAMVSLIVEPDIIDKIKDINETLTIEGFSVSSCRERDEALHVNMGNPPQTLGQG